MHLVSITVTVMRAIRSAVDALRLVCTCPLAAVGEAVSILLLSGGWNLSLLRKRAFWR